MRTVTVKGFSVAKPQKSHNMHKILKLQHDGF